jgi:hypothetical protein
MVLIGVGAGLCARPGCMVKRYKGIRYIRDIEDIRFLIDIWRMYADEHNNTGYDLIGWDNFWGD